MEKKICIGKGGRIEMVPLLLGAAALWGISNVAEAESNVNAANKMNKEASELAKHAYDMVGTSHDQMISVLDNLGENKMRTSIAIGMAGDFIEDITKVLKRNRDTESLRELDEAGINEKLLSQMHNLSQQAQQFGVDDIKQMDASENENAVCVFGALGGAALGFGMVAIPAMFIYSFMKSDEAEAAYYEAKTRVDEAKVYEERCNNICSLFNAITTRGEQIDTLLHGLNEYFVPAVESLSQIMDKYGNNYAQYPMEAKMTVHYSFQLAQTVKAIVETSMFQEDGSFNTDIDATVEIGEQTIALLESSE